MEGPDTALAVAGWLGSPSLLVGSRPVSRGFIHFLHGSILWLTFGTDLETVKAKAEIGGAVSLNELKVRLFVLMNLSFSFSSFFFLV